MPKKVFPGSSSFRRTHVQKTANKQTNNRRPNKKQGCRMDRQTKIERERDRWVEAYVGER